MNISKVTVVWFWGSAVGQRGGVSSVLSSTFTYRRRRRPHGDSPCFYSSAACPPPLRLFCLPRPPPPAPCLTTAHVTDSVLREGPRRPSLKVRLWPRPSSRTAPARTLSRTLSGGRWAAARPPAGQSPRFSHVVVRCILVHARHHEDPALHARRRVLLPERGAALDTSARPASSVPVPAGAPGPSSSARCLPTAPPFCVSFPSGFFGVSNPSGEVAWFPRTKKSKYHTRYNNFVRYKPQNPSMVTFLGQENQNYPRQSTLGRVRFTAESENSRHEWFPRTRGETLRYVVSLFWLLLLRGIHIIILGSWYPDSTVKSRCSARLSKLDVVGAPCNVMAHVERRDLCGRSARAIKCFGPTVFSPCLLRNLTMDDSPT